MHCDTVADICKLQSKCYPAWQQKEKAKEAKEKRRQNEKNKKRLDSLQRSLEKAEASIEELDEQMAAAGTDLPKLQDLQKKKDEVLEKVLI